MSVFVANIIPKRQIINYKNISQAAHNFCFSFIEATNPEIVYSLIPIAIETKTKFDFGSLHVVQIQSRSFPHKFIFKFFNILIENILLCINILKNRHDNIWFYNLTIHNVYSFTILRFIFRKKCFVIVADLDPYFSIFDRNFHIAKLLSKSSGIIAFSSNIVATIKNKNIVVIPGIVNEKPSNITSNSKHRSINREQILFSGTLIELTGLDLVLETFSELNTIELLLTGSGDDTLVKKYAEKYSNIIYLGFLEYTEYLNVLEEVDLVLNLRNPAFLENSNNFPSKVLEYLLNSKIVISTLQYDTLPDKTLFNILYDKECLKTMISKILNMKNVDLKKITETNRQMVIDNFSFLTWRNAMLKLEKVI